MASTSPCRRIASLMMATVATLSFGFACQSTPSTGNAPPASSLCVSCHLSEFEATTHPPHAGVRPTTCGTCHSTDGWHPYRLQHSWPLEGAHAKANCLACHSAASPLFEGTSKACVSCHKAAQDKANASVASHPSFPPTCEKCHNTIAWKPTLPHETMPESNTPIAPPHLSSRAATRHAAAASRATSARKTPSAAPKPVTITPAPAINRPSPDVVSGASTTRRK